jgi:uncharacterized protein YkwD
MFRGCCCWSLVLGLSVLSVLPAPVAAAGAKANPRAAGAFDRKMIESAIIRLTNVERQKAGLQPLRINPTLVSVAEKYSDLMASRQMMDHHLDGKDGGQRLKEAGYSYSWWGENIAWNYADANAVVQGWMNSPPHRQNLLSPNVTEIGVGVAYSVKNEPYYCQVFAHPAG